MKARTLIIMTGAILALTASAAQANLDRMLPAKPTFAVHHKVVTHKKVVAHKVGKNQSTGPRYIRIPGSGGQPSTYVDDCLSSGNNCTDQQLCDIWGMNCDLVTSAPANVAAPTGSAPDASSTTTAPSTDSAPTGSSASTNSTASDDYSMLCPGGSLWDAEYQYCD